MSSQQRARINPTLLVLTSAIAIPLSAGPGPDARAQVPIGSHGPTEQQVPALPSEQASGTSLFEDFGAGHLGDSVADWSPGAFDQMGHLDRSWPGWTARLLSPLNDVEDPDGAIDTDRPSFTPTTGLVPVGRAQIESGYTFVTDESSSERSFTHVFPESALRIGLAPRGELRLFWPGWSYDEVEDRTTGLSTTSNGSLDMEVGFKWGLIEQQDGLLPKTSLITSILVPTGSGTNSGDTVLPFGFLLYSWSLTDKIGLLGGTGLFNANEFLQDGQPVDGFVEASQSLLVSYALADRWTTYYEYFVLFRTDSADDRPAHSMNGGLLYRPTDNLQFDVRAGFGLGDRAEDFFTGAGVSFRY